MHTFRARAFRLALVLTFTGLPTFAIHAAPDRAVRPEEALASTIDKLRHDLRSTHRDNLSERIRILETIQSVGGGLDPKLSSELASLVDRHGRILEALASDASSGPVFADSFKQVLAAADSFSADPALRRRLETSTFLESLAKRIRRDIEKGEVATAESLVSSLQPTRLASIVSPVLSQALSQGCQRRIDTLLASQTQPTHAHPSLDFFANQLLGDGSDQLSLALAIEAPAGSDPSLLRDSLLRRWGHRFEISLASDAEGSPPPLVQATVSLGTLDKKNQIETEEISSSIPGLLVVKENPDFKKALYLYESADQIYQDELELYHKYEHAEYLEDLKEVREQARRSVLNEESNNPGYIPPPSEYPNEESDNGFVENAGDLMKIEFETQKLARLRNIKHPEPPEPPHERLLKNLQETPSTLRTQEDGEPYSYRRLKHATEFSQSAEIALQTATAPAALVRAEPTLTHNNVWFENEGVHPRDHSAEPGNFSTAAEQSAQRLFQLKFSADCVKSIESALDQLAAKLWSLAEQANESHNAELAVAIKLSTVAISQRSPTLEEGLELSRSLAAPGLSRADAHRILLALALKKTGWTDKSASLDQLAAN